MTEFDDKLRAALDADDEAFLQELDEGRGMFAQIGDTFAGPLGGWAKLIFFVALVLGIGLLYAVWQLFTADTDRELFIWVTATLALLMAQGFVKQWFFERMNLMTILRELKRIELRVARIEERG
ncbi:hypothetical protein HFP51_01320 [Parasphingopyxis sp. CP4]|uniref:DUF6768 family protein n=1 Tax=Parasphingopyxis sp. CP4 TaxID=2724527 RepID=UPI0015A39511|nr:DUF6768 family protein [Parasphingopyxis sp. CP4]QLC20943.1 hypothetical protein HFP51_01320 [Parasphingopyxis sp. CP4]